MLFAIANSIVVRFARYAAHHFSYFNHNFKYSRLHDEAEKEAK